MPRTLRLVLGDQLNAAHSWFSQKSDQTAYLLMEMKQETGYVRHHVQKVVAFFLAMRAFAERLEAQGHAVRYLRLDDPGNAQNLPENVKKILAEENFDRFEYQLPDEWRLDRQLADLCQELETEGFQTASADTEHFLTTRYEVRDFFAGKKQYLLESFYRQMRRRYDLLMAGQDPVGGKWNFDADNRDRYDGKTPVPSLPTFKRGVSHIVQTLAAQGVETIGRIDAKAFPYPVTREEGLQMLQSFVSERLPRFGTYQDAMDRQEPFLFHSMLSFLMNAKILSPLEVVRAAIAEHERRPEAIDLAQTEGFVRQIIGWREYMRGVYWAKMPEYAQMNFFGHDRPLPGYFWTGQTQMACVSHAVNASLDHAYAHHIQRLMVTSNFALLAGVHPDEVDRWYLGIYIDAIEWVEITNTRGMGQFADGGIVGTKPYVSSANYLHKMSDYCKGCHYDRKKKVGDDACPFNSLYWHFYDRNRHKLEKNPRIGMAYRTMNKMKDLPQILEQAEKHLANVENL